jgi:hypothetical protein
MGMRHWHYAPSGDISYTDDCPCLHCHLISEEYERNLAATRVEHRDHILVRPGIAAGGMLGTQADREQWRRDQEACRGTL